MGRRALPTLIAIAAIAAFLAAGCSRYRRFEAGSLHGEGPRAWRSIPGNGHITFFVSPESVGEVSAHLSVAEDQPRTRESITAGLERERRDSASDPNFSLAELREFQIAGEVGLLVEETRTEPVLSAHHAGPPAPGVRYREQTIYFSRGGKAYSVTYGTPVDLYEKYRREFEHFAGSLRIDP